MNLDQGWNQSENSNRIVDLFIKQLFGEYGFCRVQLLHRERRIGADGI